MKSVSFIIPHKGREQFLRDTVETIAQQDADVPRSVCVVTQNQALEPETLRRLEASDAQIIYAPADLTISALRNLGVQHSTGTHFAFLDADIALSPNWLETMLAILESEDGVVLASAMQVGSNSPTVVEEIRVALSNAVLDAPVTFLPGRNLLLSRETFDAVGGFPEHLTTCEDYYFTHKTANLGTLWYSSHSSYVHLGEDRQLDEMFRKEIWRGQSNLQSLGGRRVELREWPSFVLPTWICAALIVALALALAGYQGFALLAAVAALLPFGAYVTRLYLLMKKRTPIADIIAFYGYYFPARAIGTVLGVFRTLGPNLHDR